MSDCMINHKCPLSKAREIDSIFSDTIGTAGSRLGKGVFGLLWLEKEKSLEPLSTINATFFTELYIADRKVTIISWRVLRYYVRYYVN